MINIEVQGWLPRSGKGEDVHVSHTECKPAAEVHVEDEARGQSAAQRICGGVFGRIVDVRGAALQARTPPPGFMVRI